MIDINNKVLLHLSLIKNIGPVTILRILKRFFEVETVNNFEYSKIYNSKIINSDSNLDIIYSFNFKDLVNQFGVSEKNSQILVKGLLDKKILENELALIEKYKIDLYTILDDDYPSLLKQIYAPPVILYCKGARFENYPRSLAIVGARNADDYSKRIIINLMPDLIKNDYIIVSGGAIGVDTMAHKSAVKFGGKTLIVLGSGLLKPYPLDNKEFFKNVIENKNGILISSFPLLKSPESRNFPARNRIIAGLSLGCLVVQAAQKSGALITAQYSIDEGRSVFAIPGNIFNKLSVGCNNIIKQGAKLVNSVDDILEEFGQIKCYKNLINKKEEVEENNSIEDLILQHIDNVSSIDELSFKITCNIKELQEKLFDLELNGKLKQNFNGFWKKVIF